MSVAFLFPGQGSQVVGMGHDLYRRDAAAHAVFDQANAQLGYPLADLCFFGPEAALTDTAHQQPAIFVTSVAAWRVMEEKGWQRPAFVAGHSLGEFSALVAAGSLTFADGLELVRQRGLLMKAAGEQNPGAMAAILGMEAAEVEAICTQAQAATGRPLQVANDNCPGQMVISGDGMALDEAMRLAMAAGARKVVKLPISIAAHSSLMAGAAAEFAQVVERAPVARPQVAVIANGSARPLATPEEIRAELKAQLTEAVRWTETVRYLVAQGVDTFIEVGPGDVLLSLVKRVERNTKRMKFEIRD